MSAWKARRDEFARTRVRAFRGKLSHTRPVWITKMLKSTLAAIDGNRLLEGPSGRHAAEAQIKDLHRQLMLKEF